MAWARGEGELSSLQVACKPRDSALSREVNRSPLSAHKVEVGVCNGLCHVLIRYFFWTDSFQQDAVWPHQSGASVGDLHLSHRTCSSQARS